MNKTFYSLLHTFINNRLTFSDKRRLFEWQSAKYWFFEQCEQILNIFPFALMQKRGCDDMHEIETNEKAKISFTISNHHFFLNWLQNKIPKAKSRYHLDNLIHDCFPWWHIAITSSEKFHRSWITPTNAKERSRGASLLMVMDGALLCSLMEQGNGLFSDWEIHLCAILPSWFFGKDSRFCFPKSRAHLPLLLGVFN